jgi:hypothetical protein
MKGHSIFSNANEKVRSDGEAAIPCFPLQKLPSLHSAHHQIAAQRVTVRNFFRAALVSLRSRLLRLDDPSKGMQYWMRHRVLSKTRDAKRILSFGFEPLSFG